MIHKSPNGFPNLINEELNKIFNELMALIVFMFLVVSNKRRYPKNTYPNSRFN